MSVDEPNKPVSKGSKGWFTFMFSVDMPINPDNMNMIELHNICGFACLIIKKNEVRMRKKDIIVCIMLYVRGISIMNIGIIIIKRIIDEEEPMRVSSIALCACPFNR